MVRAGSRLHLAVAAAAQSPLPSSTGSVNLQITKNINITAFFSIDFACYDQAL
jgi:hypothetical protein